MQEEGRVPRLLDRIDLTRFQLKEYRNFDDCEYRSPSLSSKLPGKAFQIIYNHNFNHDLLVTHIDLQFHHKETFSQLFEMGQIEASKITNRGMLGPVVRQKPPKNNRQEKSLTVSCICITQSLKVSLLLKKQLMIGYSDSLSFRKEKSKQASQQNTLKIIKHSIKAINICGFHLSISTSASELMPLLNISQALKQASRLEEAAETDILVSLSFISARRFVQAAQSLRNASKFYVQKYISSKSLMDFSRMDKLWVKQQNKDQLQQSSFSRTFSSARGLEGGRYLYKAAKIELLLADTINQPSLLGQKLQAYNRANSFANGEISPCKLQPRIDYEEVAYVIAPTIMPFLVKVLSDKAEIYKISALKSIEFFFETLGGTLGNFMPLVLKALISVYPSHKEREESGLKLQNGSNEKPPTSSRTKLLLDHTNHLLQSLLSLLPGISKKCLKAIYQQIIQINLSNDFRNELRLYLLRFGERIMQICASDLDIAVRYIRYLLTMADGKFTLKSDTSKHISHNLVFFSQRAIDLLKNKILKQYNRPNSLVTITNWINQTLIALCENQTISSQSHLSNTLDLLIAVYATPKPSLGTPIQPIIYLLNNSLNEPKLPFQKILQAFTVLVRHQICSQRGNQLANEIIERVLGRSKICSLGIKELKILQRILDTVRQVKSWWLEDFLQCIPHSNYDEIYTIFDLLVFKATKCLDKKLIQQIINTLFNQYTVKGKAHQQSKQLYINNLLKELPQSFTLLLQICLFENHQPRIEEYISKHPDPKEHAVDSKQFKLQSELFGQKISLLVQVVSKNELVIDKLKEELSSQLIFQFYQSSNQILNKSKNFKIKSKILILIKHFIMLIGQLPDHNMILKHKIFFCRTQLAVLRTFTCTYKDSKLQQNALLNIGLLLQKLLAIKCQQSHFTCNSTYIFQEDLTADFQLSFPLEFTLESLVFHELSKMWTNLLLLLNSPLELVRQMLIVILLNIFKEGLVKIQVNIRDKIIQQTKILLVSCLQSKDYSERLMAIRLLGLLIGLGKQYKDLSIMRNEVARSLRPFLPLIQQVILLEDDWNQQVSACSRLLVKLCVSKEFKARVLKRIQPSRKISGFLDSSNLSFNVEEEAVFDKKSSFLQVLGNLDSILRTDEDFNWQDEFEMPEISQEFARQLQNFKDQIEKINFNIRDSLTERDSFVEEEQFYDPNEEKHSDKQNQIGHSSDEEQLQFEDLGIIELDDQQWEEQENEVTITQKLPLKKVYKLSPNLGSSTKHHHLRNKRMLPTKYEEQKIIIDELQGRISSPTLQQFQESLPNYKPAYQYQQIQKMGFEDSEQSKNPMLQDFTASEGRNSSKKEKKGSKKRKVPTVK